MITDNGTKLNNSRVSNLSILIITDPSLVYQLDCVNMLLVKLSTTPLVIPNEGLTNKFNTLMKGDYITIS